MALSGRCAAHVQRNFPRSDAPRRCFGHVGGWGNGGVGMSAVGPKRTCRQIRLMSAFGGRPDINRANFSVVEQRQPRGLLPAQQHWVARYILHFMNISTGCPRFVQGGPQPCEGKGQVVQSASKAPHHVTDRDWGS